ncbi:hypothetical protein GJAV_G00197500 [Gymnothorax javanicus]|nr:hypothetical protein GJAV_G00197500 [Gymnothorax javanicus]
MVFWRSLLLVLARLSTTCLGQAADGRGNGDRKGLISGNGLINLGQTWGSRSPLMHLNANLSELTSLKSSFEFRTLDPEGVVLYGETKGCAEWFVLGLRGGVPEMQVGIARTLTSVAGGPKINDGKWHKVELQNEGDFFELGIDGKTALMLGLRTNRDDCLMAAQMRLALGGILIKELELLNPLREEMDGCVRAGNWLNLSTPWEMHLREDPRPCFHEIRKGSFFSGTGLALFNTSDFPSKLTGEEGVEVKIQGCSSMWNGTILSLMNSQNKPVLIITARPQTEELFVMLGTRIAKLKLGPDTLVLALSSSYIVVEFGQKEPLWLMDATHDWVRMWDEGVLLAFGGVPGDSHAKLEGCLSLIQIQRQDVDLDQALQKHNSISSHSCPFTPQTMKNNSLDEIN